MTDITKCYGDECPLKEQCYRYTAPANPYYQAFFIKPPILDGQCEMFYETMKEDLKNKINKKARIYVKRAI